MANTYKNIVITPSIGSNTVDPKIVFSGANTNTNTDITVYIYPTANGTLSFEGSVGQLFSITNDLSNNIFRAADISGVPLIDAFANGLVALVPTSGNVGIGNTTPAHKLSVNGLGYFVGNVTVGNSSVNASVFANSSGVYFGGTALTANNANNLNGKTEGNLNVNNATTAYSKTEGNLNVNSAAIVTSNTSTNTFQIGTASYFVSNGNFGIATSSPGYKLDVNGGLNTTGGLRLAPNNVGGNSATALGTLFNLNGTGASAFAWNYTTGGGELDLFINRNGGGTGGLNIYDFTSNSTTQILSVSGAGLVNAAASYYVGTTLIGNSTGPYGKTEGNLNVNNATTAGTATYLNSAASSTDQADITTRVNSGFWQYSLGTLALGWPTNSGGWHHLMSSTHSNGSNYYAMQLAARFDVQAWYLRNTNNSGTTAWSQIVTNSGTWSINVSGTAYGKTEGNLNVNSAVTFSSTTQNSQFNSVGVGTAASTTAGEIRATNNITAYYSDKRLKENIKQIDNALEKLSKISGVEYNSNDLAASFGYTDKSTQVGVLAQEIQKVLPMAVKAAPFDIAKNDDGEEYSKSGENYLTVQYEKLIPLLIEAIKEQQAQIQELKTLIKG